MNICDHSTSLYKIVRHFIGNIDGNLKNSFTEADKLYKPKAIGFNIDNQNCHWQYTWMLVIGPDWLEMGLNFGWK